MKVNCCFVGLMMLGLSAVAQESSTTDSATEAAEQMKIARANVTLFRIQDAETGADIERMENPALRYTEPVRGPTHGMVWLWGRKGRPAAVLEMIREADRFCSSKNET